MAIKRRMPRTTGYSNLQFRDPLDPFSPRRRSRANEDLHTMVVTVSDPSKQLIEETFENVRLQAALAHVQILLEVLIQVLEHKRQFALRMDHVI